VTDHYEIVHTLTGDFTPQALTRFLRRACPVFAPAHADLTDYVREDDPFDHARQLGRMDFDQSARLLAAAVHVDGELSSRSSRGKQFDFAKRVLRHDTLDGGLFAFYDNYGHFRLSLITVSYHGTKRRFSNYRRQTFFVSRDLPNKTFIQQMRAATFNSLDDLLRAFSLEAVSEEFYKEFKPHFDAIAAAVRGAAADQTLREGFALLFVIRTIFLGFVQKKGWLGDNPRFLQDFWKEYEQSEHSKDTFYKEWLEPLFFEALNAPPGRKVAYGHAPFSEDIQRALQMAPYLNGELFKRKQGVDDLGLWIPDGEIEAFFDFLFQYNFTVEENELYDEELEVNPEFLGIIFERLTNQDMGAIYTPRVEVDLMCRLALVKWLEANTHIDKRDLYHLFFREAGTGQESDEYQKQGDFSPAEIRELIEKLESITVCDPAAGSGAFEVGMLQVLDATLANLYGRNNTPADLKIKAPDPFERKKAIIANSLYGVEVKRWAVWINHLRLWLSLFVDMPDHFRSSFEPLLPNLTFKVRTGDSLVQRIAGKTFPVQGYVDLPSTVKHKIAALKKRKRDFFYNQSGDYRLIEKEELDVFRAILDAEIQGRRQQLRSLLAPREKQAAFIEPIEEQLDLDLAKATAAQRQQLEREIAELQQQKQSLLEGRPFIWTIEFAEIFFDRGGFDIIIGNPPYLRQERIRDPYGVLEPKAYKDALLEMVRLDFPDHFARSPAKLDEFKKGRRPSGHSDLYTYFYIRGLRLLNPRGLHVFICSNSWLDVGYGAWLQEFLLRTTPIHFVIDNHARRSFARADVNTIISVLGAPGSLQNSVLEKHVARFVAFKRPFEEAVLSDNLLAIEAAQAIVRADEYRVYPATHAHLLAEGHSDGKYQGDKWGGKYLRAPDIFFTILEKGKGKLVKLGDIADIRRGFTTGANHFFYLEPLGPGSRAGLLRVRNGAGWEGEIEDEFLKPVIKSPRECRSIVIKPEELHYRLFVCSKSKHELKGTKALEYILLGESVGFHSRPSCRGRRHWWSLSEGATNSNAVLHFNYLINDIGRTFVGNCFASDNFHEIDLPQSYAIFLNSSVFALFQLVEGRTNFGGGLLKIQAFELQHLFVDKDAFDYPDDILTSLKNRSIFVECGIDPESDIPIAQQEPQPLPDRKALDDIVFDTLGLTEEERKEVYRAVCQLVWERISKAKSV